MVEDNAAELHLGEQRIIPGPAVTGKYLDMIRLDAKTGAFFRNIIGNDEVEVLLRKFLSRVILNIGRFCGKADQQLMRLFLAKFINSPSCFLILLAATTLGR